MTTPVTAPPTPKPKRSKRRWFFVGGFVLALLATPYVYVSVVGTLRERELEQIFAELDAEDPNWRWADMVKQMPPVAPDERNAMVQLDKVIGIMKPTPFGAGPLAGKKLGAANVRLADADAQRLQTVLAALAPTTVAEAIKLKDMPEGGIALDPSVSAKDMKLDIVKILNVTRVLEHAAMLHAHEGEPDKAADACLAILHSAHAIGDAPSLMAQLIRTALQVQAVGAMERTLGQGSVDEKQLALLQKAMEIEANHNGAIHAMRGERAFGLDFYQSLCEGNAESEKMIHDLQQSGSIKRKLYFTFFPGMLLQGYPECLRHQNDMIRACKLDNEARLAALTNLGNSKDVSYPIWGVAMRFLPNQIQGLIDDRTRTRCAVAAIAVERYRLKYEHWPAEMADLVKEGLLKAPVIDPYDGQPLRFQRTPSGLIVYSIGADKTDNRGAKGDIAFELWLPMHRVVLPLPTVEKIPQK